MSEFERARAGLAALVPTTTLELEEVTEYLRRACDACSDRDGVLDVLKLAGTIVMQTAALRVDQGLSCDGHMNFMRTNISANYERVADIIPLPKTRLENYQALGFDTDELMAICRKNHANAANYLFANFDQIVTEGASITGGMPIQPHIAFNEIVRRVNLVGNWVALTFSEADLNILHDKHFLPLELKGFVGDNAMRADIVESSNGSIVLRVTAADGGPLRGKISLRLGMGHPPGIE